MLPSSLAFVPFLPSYYCHNKSRADRRVA
jgi:hypothetical protein